LTSFRRLSHLTWARPSHKRAAGQRARPGTQKARGLLLEQHVASRLPPPPRTLHGQWFAFRDDNGFGFCQPDFILPFLNPILVFECKLTYHPYVSAQLRHLYIPIVEFVYMKPAIGYVLTEKNWQTKLAEIFPS
jgi:hypothetical protein